MQSSAGSTPSQWVVRRGTHGGTNWSTADTCTFPGSSSYFSSPQGITADTAGNVYVAGVVYYTNGTYAWTVRKGIGGTNWFTVDSFSPGGYGWAQGVFAHPTAGLFAVGKADNIVISKNKEYISTAWMVRRSLDGGTNWATVDVFQISSGYYAMAYGVGADQSGNLYVVGQANLLVRPGWYATWAVRKSTDGGNTWATVDDFQLCTTCPARATGFAADSKGNLFVAGQAESSSGAWIWIVRENIGGNSGWATSDNFPVGYEPHAIAADSLGNVFAGGFCDCSTGVNWLVRKN
jgi:hypothetical protein